MNCRALLVSENVCINGQRDASVAVTELLLNQSRGRAIREQSRRRSMSHGDEELVTWEEFLEFARALKKSNAIDPAETILRVVVYENPFIGPFDERLADLWRRWDKG